MDEAEVMAVQVAAVAEREKNRITNATLRIIARYLGVPKGGPATFGSIKAEIERLKKKAGE